MLLKKEIYIKPYRDNRTLHIYLPDTLDQNNPPGVLYMFDGHNLFSDEDATYGKSWGLSKYLKQKQLNIMVVGLECNHIGNKRLCEFSPYSFKDEYFGTIEASGKTLLQWMSTDLKDYIEHHFIVNTSKEKTMIAGSSMGGLMALYAGFTYSHIYSKAACLSPFYEHIYDALFNDCQNCQSLKGSTFYLSWGRHEWRTKRALAIGSEKNLRIARLLTKKGASVYPHCQEHGYHNESSWEKEIPLFMEDLKIE
ncbi:MAG: alpha/beta hydrolase [Erysipelotrichia bacterium]|nr:alpha/beta hydrolase [Erysipelotrichia bacterium]NCC54274.1 alpha/beta hydrolase [Erysipelotrichia bacterium]